MTPVISLPQQPTRAVPSRQLVVIRRWLLLFMGCLLLSGLTAFPIETLLAFTLQQWPLGLQQSAPYEWVLKVYKAVAATNQQYPFLAYGTDWLAFAHILFTILFIGAWKDPYRNRWLIDFGLIACAAIPILAFSAGAVRGIPLYWQLIDTSFGVIGALPLWLVRQKIQSSAHGKQ
ncbi:MAG: hypothetical protein LCH51_17065 [Bacteroidetes bacterium]|nr:hypothetical protein [Bacteroidota bacterium]